MEPAPHYRRRRACLRKQAILSAAVASLLPAVHAHAVTVSWVTNFSGPWTSTYYWSTHAVPGPTDDVLIDRPNGTYTVTLFSGSQSVHSLTSNENLAVTGGTLAVATTAQIGGALTLNGGALNGGTWTTTGSGTMSATGGTLSGVILGGDLTFSGSTLAVTNGLTLAGGTVTLSTNSGFPIVNFNGNQTLGGTGTILFNGLGAILGMNGALTVAPAITIATGTGTGTGTGTISFGSSGLNQGTISSQTSGQSVNVTGSNWTNAGTLSATNGGTLSIDTSSYGSWTNTGTVSVGSGGSVSLGQTWPGETWSNLGTFNVGSGGNLTLGGTFTPASIGTLVNQGSVYIDGTLNNTGNTLALDGGAFSLGSHGTIIGGTVDTNGVRATAKGTLSGVTLDGNLTVPSYGMLTVANGLTLAGDAITLASSGGVCTLNITGRQTIGGTGSILFSGGGRIISNGQLTIAPGITIATAAASDTISGSVSLGSYSINQGTISSQISGKSISVTGTSWINAGTLAATNGGTLSLEGSWINTGTLSVGTGSTVYLSSGLNAATWSNLGAFNVASGGTLYLGGNFTPPPSAPSTTMAPSPSSGRWTMPGIP